MKYVQGRGGELAAALLLGLCACGPADPGDGGGDGGPGPGPGPGDPPAEVTGTVIDTFVTDAAEVQRPRDLTKVPIAALVPNANGTFSRIAGSATASGTFLVPGVPAGTYYLQFGESTYLVTATRTLDLGQTFLGRPDRVRPTLSPSVVELTVDRMDAWADVDGLAVYSATAGGSEPLADIRGLGLPQEGEKVIQLSINAAAAYSPFLVDSNKGDRVQLLHLAGRTTAGGVPYQAVSQIFKAPSFSLTDGGVGSASGSFESVPQDHTLRYDWRRSQFMALRTAVSPNASVYGSSLQLFAYPRAAAYGDYGAGALLAALYQQSETTDLNAGELTYGDPYPTDWAQVTSTGVTFVATYQVDGAAAGGAGAAVYVISDSSRTSAGPVQPLVGPVTQPKIGGKDAFGQQSGVGLRPTLSWGAPAVGQATGYQVFLYQLFAQGGQTRRTLLASLRTTGTSVAVPPNLLESSSVYTASIVAINRGSIDLDSKPFRKALPESGAGALLGTFTP